MSVEPAERSITCGGQKGEEWEELWVHETASDPGVAIVCYFHCDTWKVTEFDFGGDVHTRL